VRGGESAKRIEVVIDELVLVGFEPHDRHAIGDAVQHWLAAHAASGDLSSMGTIHRDVSAVRGPDALVAATGAARRVDAIASGIARSVVNAVTHGSQ